MARKKKRKKRQAVNKTPHEKRRAFNPLLERSPDLKKWIQETGRKTGELQKSGQDMEKEGPSDDEIFLNAVQDVRPLPTDKTIVARHPDLSVRPPHPAPNEDLEAMTQLWELVHGSGEMDISFSDEYMEGSIRGFDKKLMRRLRKGEFPVQDHLDLHGLTKKEAEVQVRDFLIQSYGRGLRCVLLIHGRGLNSEDHIPILKERVPVWLSRGPARKFVLAFSTARPYDGGTGAIYVLLRKKKGQPYLQVY